jgi:ubiquinone/menaquinone biosynthesis C-methylase UbiE
MKTVLYDHIGTRYDTTRQADPEIIHRLYEILSPQEQQRFLDIGCGSGNYTIALAKKGMSITGLDVSEAMLSQARAKQSAVAWIQGDAKALPFQDDHFDGILCFLAIHHIRSLPLFFKEVYRVLKPAGKFLMFTNTPTQFMQLWLVEYFPKIMEKAASRLFAQEELEHELKNAGFQAVTFERYCVTEHLKDAFLETAKYHPELCLDENFRANTSPFALAPDQQEVRLGLERLAQDIESGEIEKVVDSFPNPDGNFFYVLANKLKCHSGYCGGGACGAGA